MKPFISCSPSLPFVESCIFHLSGHPLDENDDKRWDNTYVKARGLEARCELVRRLSIHTTYVCELVYTDRSPRAGGKETVRETCPPGDSLSRT